MAVKRYERVDEIVIDGVDDAAQVVIGKDGQLTISTQEQVVYVLPEDYQVVGSDNLRVVDNRPKLLR